VHRETRQGEQFIGLLQRELNRIYGHESILSVEDNMIDVGPELFGDIKDAIKGDLRGPLLAGLRRGSFPRRIIQVG
jgi:hypothetical protein